MARNGSEMGSTIEGAALGNEQRHAPPPALVPALSRDPLANENHAGGRHWAPGQARGKLATEQASFRARAKPATRNLTPRSSRFRLSLRSAGTTGGAWMKRIRTTLASALGCGAASLAALALAATAAPASAEGVYFRIGGGYDWATPATFTDRDCTIAPPPFALYGCGVGNDGLPIGAYGSFGGSPAFEAAVGFHAAPALRIETAVSFRHGFAFAGDANFSGTPEPQPVTASFSQAAVMGWALVDLGTVAGGGWPLNPFIGMGVGVSRNALSEMYFAFPGLSQPAWSETPGGVRYSPAFGFTAGVSRELSERLAVELAWRHVNYGRVATDAGDLVSQRGGPEFVIAIDETWTMLSTNAVMLSLRWELRAVR